MGVTPGVLRTSKFLGYSVNMEDSCKVSQWRDGVVCIYITFTFMHLADAFIQSDLQLQSGYTFFN